MKNLIKTAAIAAALSALASTTAAFAADTAPTSQTGHFEWRGQPSFGPRSPTRAPIRVWVADDSAMAATCGGADRAADCMAMPTKGRSAIQG